MPKNVILFLGDGMGITVTTAARIYKSQSRNTPYQQPFHFETWPHTALVKTHSADAHVTESAAAASAILCGAKIPNDRIGAAHSVHRSEEGVLETNLVSLECLASLAIKSGKSVGVVTTTRVTHASPASLYAKTSYRWNEAHSEDERYQDIAGQLIDKLPGKNLTVIFGGGSSFFEPCPESQTFENLTSKLNCRRDGRNLTQEWLETSPDRILVRTLPELDAFIEKLDEKSESSQIMGLFAKSHLDYILDRPQDSQQPTLADMTSAAVKILSRNKNGYFLFVEGGQIDIALHLNKAKKSFEELIEFERAIVEVTPLVDIENTLMIVTADHSHNLNLVGYALKNVSVLGYISQNDRAPTLDKTKNWTILNFIDGPAAKSVLISDPDDKDYQQTAMIYRSMASHGGEEVAAYAVGPMSNLFAGLIENTDIFYFVCFVLKLEPCSNDGTWDQLDHHRNNMKGNHNDLARQFDASPLVVVFALLFLAALGLNIILWCRLKQAKVSINA